LAQASGSHCGALLPADRGSLGAYLQDELMADPHTILKETFGFDHFRGVRVSAR